MKTTPGWMKLLSTWKSAAHAAPSPSAVIWVHLCPSVVSTAEFGFKGGEEPQRAKVEPARTGNGHVQSWAEWMAEVKREFRRERMERLGLLKKDAAKLNADPDHWSPSCPGCAPTWAIPVWLRSLTWMQGAGQRRATHRTLFLPARPGVVEAFGNVVCLMQPQTQELACHAIAHFMDWHNRAEIWQAANLPNTVRLSDTGSLGPGVPGHRGPFRVIAIW